MKELELLAPARNADIGIAAIDCGADAVYIAAEEFGARKDAGNPMEEVGRLCGYAHRFGARVFLTVNIELRDGELDRVHSTMLRAAELGVDAFIIRDMRIAAWDDIGVPLHASTQCAIRTVEDARRYEAAGCSRIILERELPLTTVREICRGVGCEVEFFVHGALCTCYSGDCRLSEYIDGRSADRGECIQACRSLYDLVDENGRTLVRSKALLSLKDYNLKERLGELAGAGVSSFKIEGRLKNASYVKNVTRDYSLALDALVASRPEEYCRASFGRVSGGFTPDTRKTFNRGYTELFIDGKRGKWSSMDAPKSMGEAVGRVRSIRRTAAGMELTLDLASPSVRLSNGDGFAFVTPDGISGFRGDVCEGRRISCKGVNDLAEGTGLFRNINTAFEKELENNMPRREIRVGLEIRIRDGYTLEIRAESEDGRKTARVFDAGSQTARNGERALSMIRSQLSKSSAHYSFGVTGMEILSSDGSLPLLSAATLNAFRREIAADINSVPCLARPLERGNAVPSETATGSAGPRNQRELMRSKYCIRYELGMCPVHQGAKDTGRLYLVNNGRRLALGFDCGVCEMTVSATRK